MQGWAQIGVLGKVWKAGFSLSCDPAQASCSRPKNALAINSAGSALPPEEASLPQSSCDSIPSGNFQGRYSFGSGFENNEESVDWLFPRASSSGPLAHIFCVLIIDQVLIFPTSVPCTNQTALAPGRRKVDTGQSCSLLCGSCISGAL